jgi:hypothetical protein
VAHNPANFQRAKEIQKQMRDRVLQLRQGKTPTAEQMQQLATLLFPQQEKNAPGDHEQVLRRLCVAAPGLSAEKIVGALNGKWAAVILGNDRHYKVIIHHKTGFHEINDNSVSRVRNDHKTLVEKLTNDRKKWQPYLLSRGHREGYFLNT